MQSKQKEELNVDQMLHHAWVHLHQLLIEDIGPNPGTQTNSFPFSLLHSHWNNLFWINSQLISYLTKKWHSREQLLHLLFILILCPIMLLRVYPLHVWSEMLVNGLRKRERDRKSPFHSWVCYTTRESTAWPKQPILITGIIKPPLTKSNKLKCFQIPECQHCERIKHTAAKWKIITRWIQAWRFLY